MQAQHAAELEGLQAELALAYAQHARHAAEVEGLTAELASAHAQHARHAEEAEALQQQLELAAARAAENDQVRPLLRLASAAACRLPGLLGIPLGCTAHDKLCRTMVAPWPEGRSFGALPCGSLPCDAISCEMPCWLVLGQRK
jgi:hypothetical protein